MARLFFVACFLIYIPHSFGIICYLCNKESDLSQCSTLTECPNTEMCEANRTPDGRGGYLYTLGCIPKSICDRFIFGRRSTHLIGCCNTNYCNKNEFNQVDLTTTSTMASTPTTTTITTQVICNVCGDITTQYPCSLKDVSQNITTHKCPTDKRFCMTDFVQYRQGGSDVFKRCVTETECQQKWINESKDLDYCNRFGAVLNPSAFECHFCCSGDRCNTDIMPPESTLYKINTWK